MAPISMAGGRLYLFTRTGNKNLIITAHGGKPDPSQNIAWPPAGAGSPTLWFCSMHGKSTCTQVYEILKLLNTSAQVLLDSLKAAGFHPYLMTSVPNYHLEKYTGYHGNDTEDYADYESWVGVGGCDIVSPRNRWFSHEVRFGSIFQQKEIQDRKYKNVYCSFCRS